MADQRLGRFWAHRSEDGLKRELQLLINFLCNVTGGPMVYTGRDMKTSHKGMRIDQQDWKAFVGHVNATLDHFGLTGEDREAVVSFVESTKGDIVEAWRATIELKLRGSGQMELIGTVESLWRYPVKSMRGEELREAFVGFPGVYGDRLYAFRNSVAPKGFPYLTSRELETMLLYQPRYRNPERMTKPANLAEAEAIGPGLTPVYPDAADLALDVDTPSGDRLAIGDLKLIDLLRAKIREGHELTLLRSDRAMTDCRPISLFSIHTARQLGEELGTSLDKRRFRANIYLDLKSGRGFDEDKLVGRTLRVGAKTTIAVLDRDPRCKMITLDPDTGQQNTEVMKQLARAHETKAGVYGAVLVEGTIRPGDEISLID